MLIIYAHPRHDGNCGALLSLVEKGLKAQKTGYKVIDLYKEKFNPVLSEAEHRGGDARSNDVETYQKEIKKHDKFVFIYPDWWNNMPAVLKGFFDRVFQKGFAFDSSSGVPGGLLSGRALVLSTCAGPSFFQILIGKQRVIKNPKIDILGFCGLKTKAILTSTGNDYTRDNDPKLERAVKKGLVFLG